MSKRDGGPVFPTNALHQNFNEPEVKGMSKRDYFAAAALQGMLAYSHVNPMNGNWVENASVSVVALHAYQYADAMLAAREKQCTPA